MPTTGYNSQLPIPSKKEKDQKIQWWNYWTKLEIALCFVAFLTLLILCVSAATLASTTSFLSQKNIEESSQGICLSSGCVKTATHILEMIDEKTDPCQNFYQFACGGYLEKREIPDDKPHISTFTDIKDEVNLKLKALFRKQLDGSEPKFVKMIKDLYDSCMDLKAIEEADSEPLQKMLRSLGGWPVVVGDRWDGSKFDWLETLLTFGRFGYDHDLLIDLSVQPDKRNNTKHVIILDKTVLEMPDRTYYIKGLNDSSTAAYFKLMVQVAKKLGVNEDRADKELMEALKFETSLANYSLPLEERRNMSNLYNKYTVRELQKLVPQVNWLKYLNGLLNDPIPEDETLIVHDPIFLKKFGELITTTDKRTIANYMIWRVVKSSLSYLSKEWRDLNQEYYSVISGTNQESPRWKQCINLLSDNLGVALSSYYVKNFVPDKSEFEKGVSELFKYVRQEFLNILENIDWMDDSTKAHARDKANTMTSFIGYPQEFLDDALLIKLYENLTITNINYFKNWVNLSKWSADYFFGKLRKPSIKNDWKDHAPASDVNAYYYLLDNCIDLRAGVLQNPLFNKDRPYFMNFGSMGSIIGHEITHGFDDHGRQYDKDGNNKNWWDEKTDEKFKEKAKCIIYQYGNYTAENGLKVNGINTQGENIADNGGTKEAYLAYQSWVREHGAEQKLPGLKYTPSQLFWISAAHVECVKYRPEDLKKNIISESHSPAQFRVVGPTSNLPQFAKDYQCPLGSPMNPYKKCQIW